MTGNERRHRGTSVHRVRALISMMLAGLSLFLPDARALSAAHAPLSDSAADSVILFVLEGVDRQSLQAGPMPALSRLATGGAAAQAESPVPLEQPHPITIDATAIVSQSWWHIPGVTPSIWTSDPETSDAYRTTEVKRLPLRAGTYKFISFTFDFPFRVTAEGTVDYSQALDQCVNGRGTQTLIVRCKRTYPYGGKPDY